jgi:hypothetical protein
MGGITIQVRPVPTQPANAAVPRSIAAYRRVGETSEASSSSPAIEATTPAAIFHCSQA